MVDDPSRDKDFSFARLSDLKDIAVALKMYASLLLRPYSEPSQPSQQVSERAADVMTD